MAELVVYSRFFKGYSLVPGTMELVGIACFIISMGVTWLVTPLVIRLAHRLGAVDLPGVRKVHVEPIPRIGGLAVFLGFAVSLAFGAYAAGVLGGNDLGSVYWKGLAIAATTMMLLGLADDLWGVGFRHKFIVQILSASLVWACGFRIELLTHPLGGTLETGILSYPLTVLWIVGITNAVNLIDGLDGLATGIALITTTTLALIAFMQGLLGVTAACVALAGSLLGFLRFNFNPARIFLGDSGSMFLGFVLAVTSVRGSSKGGTLVAIMVPLLVMGIPLLDTGLAILRRVHRVSHSGARADNSFRYMVSNFKHVFLPDREHIHHQLLKAGLSHRRAVLVLYGLSGSLALGAFGLVAINSVLFAAVLLVSMAVMMASFLGLLYLRASRGVKAPEAEPSSDESPSAGEARTFAPPAPVRVSSR